MIYNRREAFKTATLYNLGKIPTSPDPFPPVEVGNFVSLGTMCQIMTPPPFFRTWELFCENSGPIPALIPKKFPSDDLLT